MNKNIILHILLLLFVSISWAQATVYSGAMDNRAGQQFIPGMIAQSKAFNSGGNPGEGIRLEWQVDNVNTPGSWTYTYRLIRGTSMNKGVAFFDIETASDFTSSNILSRQVVWATNKIGSQIPSGLAAVTISDPVDFNSVHDFSNAAVTEKTISTVLDKFDLSHYSGDPGRVPAGQPGGDASNTPSVGPVAHPFYGIRVTFPGSFANLAYEASEWEFKIVSDRPPMWGSCFGWGDQTVISPYWYSNFYNDNIDNSSRLTLPPTSNLYGTSPYRGWILVPGPLPAAQSSLLTVDVATYNRDASGQGQINLLATAQVNATLTVSGSGIASPVVMTPDTPNPVTFGKYLANIPFTSLPASVDLTNNFDSGTAPYTVPLVDEVTISQAVFDPVTRTITIRAASRDKMEPLPTLTAVDFAAPHTFDSSGIFSKVMTANPPSTVTVLSSRGGVATASVAIATQSSPASAVSILTDKPSPHVAGTPVTFTAVGSGGSGSYEFRFSFYNGTTWSRVQEYSPIATWTLPGSTVPGIYNVAVEARNVGSTAENEASAFLGYQIIPQPAPAAGVILLSSQPSPRVTGMPVTFTAVGSGGSGSYEFRFSFYNGTTWSRVQEYSPIATWTLPGSTFPGIYNVAVEVRNLGSTAENEASAFLGYQIIPQPAPPAGVILLPSQPSPHVTGTPVTFTAVGSGGSGSYEFRFNFYDGTTWSRVQEYSPIATWTLPGSKVPGTYNVAVEVRNLGSTAENEATAFLGYQVIAEPPAVAGVTVFADTSNVAAGTPVTFAAVGSGGSGRYEFRFSFFDGTNWTLVQDYSPIATWTMPGSNPAGLYTVAVEARNAGSVVERDAVTYFPYSIQ